jgi:hemerythrin-like domain-containing protein
MSDYAHADRRILKGEVDFLMMYATHDAFARHLEGLIGAIEHGMQAAASTSARWELFKHQLHVHHTVEDVSLWPPLRLAISEPDEVAVLDAMEAEHAEIDPQLARVDVALAAGDVAASAASIRDLVASLGAHMRHEENEALPLVERYLGRSGWAVFGSDMRKQHGMRGGAVFFPWLLDGAAPITSAKVLAMLPGGVRYLYRRVWEPRYRKSINRA